MNCRNIKKAMALLIALSIFLVGTINAGAVMVNYTPGPNVFYLENSDIISIKDGYIGDDGFLYLKKGSKVTYEFFLPFEANRFNINFVRPEDRSTTNLNVTMNSYTQNMEIVGFYETRDIKLKRNLNSGDVRVTMEADNNIVIRRIRFEKQPVQNWAAIMEYQTLDDSLFEGAYTEYEKALQIATVINKNSPLVKINGAMKYADYMDVSKKPLFENAEVYLPIERAANALGYYYEQDITTGYAMLRSDTMEFVLTDGKLLQQINGGAYNEIANNIVIKNNTVWVPMGFYARMQGREMSVKGDWAVIDYKTRIADIIEGKFFEELQTEFSSYIGGGMTGVTYHVAQTANASDQNSGTADAPFRTLAKAGAVAKAGETVIVHGGTYHETLAPQNDGTPTAPIVFKAAEGENVVISALEDITVTPYEEDGLLVYEMGDWDLGRGKNQIFYKGEGIREARHPNTHTSERLSPNVEHSPYFHTQGNILVKPDVNNQATSETDLNQPVDYWAGGVLLSLHYAGYRICWSNIDSSEPGILYLGEHNPYGYFADPAFGHDTDNAFITCTKNAIDIPGEWYWGEGKLWMYAPEGETAETLKLQAKKRQLTVDLKGKKNIQVKGINTFGGGMNINEAELCVIDGGQHRYISHFTYLYDNSNFQDYVRHKSAIDNIQENNPTDRGEMGICLSGRNNAVLNTNVKYSAGYGIVAGGAYHHIENNYVSDIGYGACAAGISLRVDENCFFEAQGGSTVMYNTVNNTLRSSFTMGGPSYPMAEDYGIISMIANEVAYNDFKNSILYSRDGAPVYSYYIDLGNDISKTKVHHNLVWDGFRDPNEEGSVFLIYWDNGCMNYECYDNIMFWTNPDIMRTDRSSYFIQANNGKRVHTADISWGNTEPGVVDGGKEGLCVDNYPQRKPFNSGSTHENVRQRTFNPENAGYNISSAQLSDGVTMSDNAAALNKAGEYVTFKNVDFGDKYNAFSIVYRASKNQTGDEIRVTVGDRKTSKLTANMALNSTANTLKNNITVPVYVYGCSGVKDITIESTKYASLEIAGIIPIKVDDALIDELVMGKTYANNYKEIVEDSNKTIASYTTGTTGNAGELAITGAYGGSVIKYSNVDVQRDVNNFVLAAGADATLGGDTIEIRVGDLKSPVLASITVPAQGVSNFAPVYAKLNRVLPKGVYDIYLTFKDKSKTSNVWWFGFNVAKEESVQ